MKRQLTRALTTAETYLGDLTLGKVADQLRLPTTQRRGTRLIGKLGELRDLILREDSAASLSQTSPDSSTFYTVTAGGILEFSDRGRLFGYDVFRIITLQPDGSAAIGITAEHGNTLGDDTVYDPSLRYHRDTAQSAVRFISRYV